MKCIMEQLQRRMSGPYFQHSPLNFHPSIFYTRLIRRSGCGGAGAYPSDHWARAGGHPGLDLHHHRATQRHTRQITTHSLLGTVLETPINLTCMCLDGGRKPERTPAYTGRTCKLPPSRWAWNRCEATVLTTTPPCSLL